MLAVAPPRIAVLSFDLRCATPVPSIVIGRSGSSPLQSLPNQAFNAPWQHTASTAIPIASDPPPRPVSRGFLPWRFADAGPGARGTTIMGPASENLHRNGPGDPNAPRLFTTRSCHWRCLEKIIQGCRRRTASFVLR
jgi:hypothetical protein